MSVLARCGSVALLSGLLVGGTALAQKGAEPAGSWTDPPARPAASAPAKPDDAPPRDAKSVERAPSASKASAIKPGGQPAQAATNASGATHRQATVRYPVPTRRIAAKPSSVATTRVASASRGVRWQVAARAEHELRHRTRRDRADAARRDTVERQPQHVVRSRIRRSYTDYAYGGAIAPSPYPRRAGWGQLVGDERADRIAQAHAAGYRVMRLRTYAYPGGYAGQLAPYYPGDLD